MKTHINILCCLGLIFTTSIRAAQETAKLDVHEWGTFTIVGGSDGLPIQWYQPLGALSELPAFVYPRRGADGAASYGYAKAGAPYLVRMETPVLYFYPDQPMAVTAEVTMKEGQITEWFPQQALDKFVYSLRGLPMSWNGELLPPTDAAAEKLTPPVTGAQGAHYAHAREVPGAWRFRTKKGDEVEKFIFYRGAGDAMPPYRVQALGNDIIRLAHSGDGGAIPAAFVLDVRADGARWGKFKPLPEMKKNVGEPSKNQVLNISGPSVAQAQEEKKKEVEPHVDHVLNTPAISATQAQEELAVAMRESLVEAGLSVDEAKAMVATWRDVWFSEPGTRVLALMPRDWVDSVLPLKITPAPTNLTRVFVARFEVFTPHREEALLALLSSMNKPDAASAKKLRDLQFGRFANAAVVRSQRMGEQRIVTRFYQLQSVEFNPVTTAR
jgi:hypothetical protein